MSRALCLALVLIVPAAFAADQLAEKWQKRIDSAESNYAAAVKKADDARFFAVQKANTERLKILKMAMSDATKAGDFDAATALKKKVVDAERDEPLGGEPSGADPSRPHFLCAIYGVNQSWLDVTDKLNELARSKKDFKFVVTDELLGDPAPDFTGGNTLVTRYWLGGKIHVKSEYVGREYSIQ